MLTHPHWAARIAGSDYVQVGCEPRFNALIDRVMRTHTALAGTAGDDLTVATN